MLNEMIAIQTAPADERVLMERACEALYLHHQDALMVFARSQGCDGHESGDLVQDLFVRLFRMDRLLSLHDKPLNMQRAYLCNTLRWMISNLRRHKAALRRGSGCTESLDSLLEEGHDPACFRTPATEHDRHWALSVLENCINRLRSSVSPEMWQSLEPSLFGHEAAEPRSSNTSALRVAVHRSRVRLGEMVDREAGMDGGRHSGRLLLLQSLCASN